MEVFMSKTLKPKCCAKSVGVRGFRTACNLNGTVERDGKLYCRHHDPVVVEQKKAEAKVRFEEAMKQRDAVQAADYFRRMAGESFEKAFGKAAPQAVAANLVERMTKLLLSMADGNDNLDDVDWVELVITVGDNDDFQNLVKEIKAMKAGQ
jgi:hypothetical protein